MNIRKMFTAIAVFAASINGVFAQQTYEEMERLTVNEQVTTVITATEPIRFVDISTDKIAGDQPINNTIRFKSNPRASWSRNHYYNRNLHTSRKRAFTRSIANASPSSSCAINL